jgi:hypothetical protein
VTEPVNETILCTYCIRVRLLIYTFFSRFFFVFSLFHFYTHGIFSVHFRFWKPASSDPSVYGLFCVRYAHSTDGGRLILANTGYMYGRLTGVRYK